MTYIELRKVVDTMEKTNVTYRSAVQYAIENLADAPTEILDKLNALSDSLIKKASAERKPTAKQTANEAYKADIIAFMVHGTKYSVQDIFKGVETWADDATLTPARVSALLTQLKNSGAIIRSEEKRKAFFELA